IKSFFSVAALETNDFRNFSSLFGIYDSAEENTVFNNVFHVKPGCLLEVDGAEVREHCYFRLNEFIDPAAYARQASRSSGELQEELEHLLTGSIHSMLMSDAPMGVFVSGGIDSSLISVFCPKEKPLDLFTANVVGKHSEVSDAR